MAGTHDGNQFNALQATPAEDLFKSENHTYQKRVALAWTGHTEPTLEGMSRFAGDAVSDSTTVFTFELPEHNTKLILCKQIFPELRE
jgi:hypothetical protein